MIAVLKFRVHEHGDDDHTYEFECALKGVSLNHSVYECLNLIRSRLKHGQKVSKNERALLETMRSILAEHYIEG